MMPIGMSEAMTFQVALELASSRFSQRDLLLAEDARLRRHLVFHALGPFGPR